MLAGTPYEIGLAHGRQCRKAIHRLAGERLRICLLKARQSGRPVSGDRVLEFCRRLVDVQASRLPAVHDEFAAIAEAAGIDPAQLMIANGLTDVVDVFAGPGARLPGGCTACLVAPEATEAGRALLAQTWDMHASAQDHLVVIDRRAVNEPRALILTTTGCLALIGMNAAGLAIGNNNLRPTDARAGLTYLAIIQEALRQRSAAAAINVITQAPRLSGHNYLIVGPGGELVDVETTATRFEVIEPAGPAYVHTNHYLAADLRPLEMEPPSASSTHRWERMTHLLYEQSGRITAEFLMQALGDESGRGDCRICRRDAADEARTCAAVVLDPHAGKMWVAFGPPAETSFREFAF